MEENSKTCVLVENTKKSSQNSEHCVKLKASTNFKIEDLRFLEIGDRNSGKKIQQRIEYWI